jgi:hypothetical protein
MRRAGGPQDYRFGANAAKPSPSREAKRLSCFDRR